MITLSSKYMYVNIGTIFQGICSTFTTYEFNRFVFKLSMLKFRANDPTVINMVADRLKQNNKDGEFLKKIDLIIESECVLTKDDIGYFLPLFAKMIQGVMNNPPETPFIWNILDKIKITLPLFAAKTLYNDLYAFYNGYDLLVEMYAKLTKPTITVDKQTPKITSNIQQEEGISPLNHVVDTTPLTIIDQIMALSVNNIVATSLIHITYTYFQHSTPSYINCTVTETNLTYKLIDIIPSHFMYSSSYFRRLVYSMQTTPINQFEYNINRLLMLLKENKEVQSNHVYTMMVFYLFLLYVLRYTFESHPGWFDDNVNTIITDSTLKEKLLIHHLKVYHPTLHGVILFNVCDTMGFNPSNISEDIKQLSEKYKYLIPISAVDFTKHVLQESEDTKLFPQGFKLNKEELLDLNYIQRISSIKVKQDELFRNSPLFNISSLDPSSCSQVELGKVLLYKFNSDNIISDAYRHLLNYVKDPTSIILIKDDQLPVSVKNMFQVLKEILKPNIFEKSINNTFDYYKILCKHVPDASAFPHSVLLYIVFQIIIPYYFHMNKTTLFIDQLI